MRNWIARSALPCVIALAIAPAVGAVEANFDAGNTSAAVDGYVGMAGDGWAGVWEAALTLAGDPPEPVGEPTISVVEGGTELFPGGGNYLSFAAAETSKAAVARQYAGVSAGFDAAMPHTVSFKLRIDEDVQNGGSYDSYQDRYFVCDSPGAVTGTTYDNSWSLFSFATDKGPLPAKNWGVFDGTCDNSGLTDARIVDTGIPLVGGTVYDVEMTVDPSRRLYSAAISDGVNSFYQENLRFRTAEYAVGSTLSFGVLSEAAADTREFSLDAISIEQTTLNWNLPSAIEARFSDGNTSDPDGFRASSGNGWDAGWQLKSNGNASMTGLTPPTQIVSPGDSAFAGELSPGSGAYFDVRVSPTKDGVGQASAARKYDLAYGEFDAADPHYIEFEIRLEEDLSLGNFSNYEDRYAFFGAPSLYDGTKTECSWIVMAFGADDGSGHITPASWLFYNGGRDSGGFDTSLFADSGIALETGMTYQFQITIDPETGMYDAYVSNGTDSAFFEDLGFRTGSGDIGRYIHFNGRGNQAVEMRHVAVDNLAISQVPEPSTAILLLLGAFGVLFGKRPAR